MTSFGQSAAEVCSPQPRETLRVSSLPMPREARQHCSTGSSKTKSTSDPLQPAAAKSVAEQGTARSHPGRASTVADLNAVFSERPSRRPRKQNARRPGQQRLIDEGTREKVVAMLVDVLTKHSLGVDLVAHGQAIEAELFAKLGTCVRDYRCRARSIVFNLAKVGSGSLVSRVLNGQLLATEVVNLGAEDLATDELRAARQRDREQYFRTEVHLQDKLVKRRRGDADRRRQGAVAPSSSTSSSSSSSSSATQAVATSSHEGRLGPLRNVTGDARPPDAGVSAFRRLVCSGRPRHVSAGASVDESEARSVGPLLPELASSGDSGDESVDATG